MLKELKNSHEFLQKLYKKSKNFPWNLKFIFCRHLQGDCSKNYNIFEKSLTFWFRNIRWKNNTLSSTNVKHLKKINYFYRNLLLYISLGIKFWFINAKCKLFEKLINTLLFWLAYRKRSRYTHHRHLCRGLNWGFCGRFFITIIWVITVRRLFFLGWLGFWHRFGWSFNWRLGNFLLILTIIWIITPRRFLLFCGLKIIKYFIVIIFEISVLTFWWLVHSFKIERLL